MAAIRKAKAIKPRYGYVRAVLLHPDVRGDLASHLLFDHPSQPVGHGDPQQKVRVRACSGASGAGGWGVVDTDWDTFVEAPSGPFLGWLRDTSRRFDAEVVGSEAGKPALFALLLQVGRGRGGAAMPGESPDDVLLGFMRGCETDAVAIVQWEGDRHVTRLEITLVLLVSYLGLNRSHKVSCQSLKGLPAKKNKKKQNTEHRYIQYIPNRITARVQREKPSAG